MGGKKSLTFIAVSVVEKRRIAFPHQAPCSTISFCSALRCLRTSLVDFPGGSDSKASAYSAGDLGSIPGLGRLLGEGHGNLLQ